MTNGEDAPSVVLDVVVLDTTGPQPPPPRRRAKRWRVLVIVAIVVAVLVPVAALAQSKVPALVRAGGRPTPSASASASVSPAQAVYARLGRVLEDQAKALLAGNADAFLAPVEPSNIALRGELTRRFNALRALGVARWIEEPSGLPEPSGDGSWTMQLSVRYCFGAPQCRTIPMRVPTRWTVDDAKVRLTEFGASDERGPRPWEVSDLHVAVGRRVVVAATGRYESRLAEAVAEADKAADVVDRYAKWGPPPEKYVLYLAGPNDWATWYGGGLSPWAAGYAYPLDVATFEVVINGGSAPVGRLGNLIRHELAHVVTLSGGSRGSQWWLSEGIAEYVRIVGGGIAFDRQADVRKFVRSGRWSGDVALGEPTADTSPEDVSGRYGMAYLAVRRIADRYGEAKMLDFFDQAQRRAFSLESASQTALGAEWSVVAADCAKYVRSRI